MSLHVIPQKLKSKMTNILSKTRVNFRKSENLVEFERGYRASYNNFGQGWMDQHSRDTNGMFKIVPSVCRGKYYKVGNSTKSN